MLTITFRTCHDIFCAVFMGEEQMQTAPQLF